VARGEANALTSVSRVSVELNRFSTPSVLVADSNL